MTDDQTDTHRRMINESKIDGSKFFDEMLKLLPIAHGLAKSGDLSLSMGIVDIVGAMARLFPLTPTTRQRMAELELYMKCSQQAAYDAESNVKLQKEEEERRIDLSFDHDRAVAEEWRKEDQDRDERRFKG